MLVQKGDVLLLDKNLRKVRTVSVEEVFRGEASPVPCSVTDKTHSLLLCDNPDWLCRALLSQCKIAVASINILMTQGFAY